MAFDTATPNVKNPPQFFHQSIFAMNTVLDMVLCSDDEGLCQSVFESVAKLVTKYELILSRYNTNSELYRLNSNASNHPVYVSKVLWKAIEAGMQFHQQTQGYFNISLGNVYQKNKEGITTKSYTEKDLIEEIKLNQETQTVYFNDEKISLDFGGLGKGIALHEAAKMIDQAGIANAFISFGGSSILTRGHHPNGDHWPLSLHSNQEKVWKHRNNAVSISSTHLQPTSGAVAHIVNPYIFQAVKSGKTAFVKAENPMVAEVLSTTLIAAPSLLHSKIISAFHKVDYEII